MFVHTRLRNRDAKIEIVGGGDQTARCHSVVTVCRTCLLCLPEVLWKMMFQMKRKALPKPAFGNFATSITNSPGSPIRQSSYTCPFTVYSFISHAHYEKLVATRCRLVARHSPNCSLTHSLPRELRESGCRSYYIRLSPSKVHMYWEPPMTDTSDNPSTAKRIRLRTGPAFTPAARIWSHATTTTLVHTPPSRLSLQSFYAYTHTHTQHTMPGQVSHPSPKLTQLPSYH
ncbi:hypothetical protein BKA63DRAFT_61586 [Paraphoma chrysanthemicola]|nr:hypothetical protein BKA63DRAFT_61586 [Paraphoma chrysanthemicola]